MKKILSAFLLLSSMSYAQDTKNNILSDIRTQFSNALAAFQFDQKDKNSLNDGSEFIDLEKKLLSIKKEIANANKAVPNLKPQFIDSLDHQLDSYEESKKDNTQRSIDLTNQIAQLQKQSPKSKNYSLQLQKLSTKRNETNALLSNKIEPLLEILKVLRSDIVYNQSKLESTIEALRIEETKNPERIKNITVADKDRAEAKGIKAYQEAKKALPACCNQKADGLSCKISDECRGSCDNGFFGNKKCQNAQKHCKDEKGDPAKCEIVRPAYYVDYMERHGLTPE